jgi:hypothetical protein
LNAKGIPVTPPLKSKVAFILIADPVVVVIMLELIKTLPAVIEFTFKLAPPPPLRPTLRVKLVEVVLA